MGFAEKLYTILCLFYKILFGFGFVISEFRCNLS